ncbi:MULTISPECIES: flagellar biosynthesis protein [Dyella]|uniref:Flagellar biosynthesis protein n=2 Tax=Dyella TaxID=231454 RepID=A0A4R0YJV9_9GAMM|nr:MULTISPECIES: flagellar biosynthesis protein [Dyella]TBR37222.1 flagellar biosynthesis protein [Dyella terrae]TCI07688.1 flagellar biosynthesis protein [Dyella soli]
MSAYLPSPTRKVSLRLAGGTTQTPASLTPEALDLLLARARALGLPIHHDAQIAALLTALRMRQDVPDELYAAASAVLGMIYRAGEGSR